MIQNIRLGLFVWLNKLLFMANNLVKSEWISLVRK